MTKRGRNVRESNQQAHDLRAGLIKVSQDAQFFMRPTMNGLNQAANASLGDGFSMIHALPSAINADNAEVAAQAEMLNEIAIFVSQVKDAFHRMTVQSPRNTLLTPDIARGRLKQCARDLYDLTRREAILEASPALGVMLEDYPNISKALDGIATAGAECADKLDQCALALQLRRSTQALR